MSAPQLTVSADGVGTVNADLLNTFEQTADTAADLRAFVFQTKIKMPARMRLEIRNLDFNPNQRKSTLEQALDVAVEVGTSR